MPGFTASIVADARQRERRDQRMIRTERCADRGSRRPGCRACCDPGSARSSVFALERAPRHLAAAPRRPPSTRASERPLSHTVTATGPGTLRRPARSLRRRSPRAALAMTAARSASSSRSGGGMRYARYTSGRDRDEHDRRHQPDDDEPSQSFIAAVRPSPGARHQVLDLEHRQQRDDLDHDRDADHRGRSPPPCRTRRTCPRGTPPTPARG